MISELHEAMLEPGFIQTTNTALCRAKLCGGRHHSRPRYVLHEAIGILRDMGLELDDVIMDFLIGPDGAVLLPIRTIEGRLRIGNSELYFAWYLVDDAIDNWFEVQAYLT